jgi:hypothetical protein
MYAICMVLLKDASKIKVYRTTIIDLADIESQAYEANPPANH